MASSRRIITSFIIPNTRTLVVLILLKGGLRKGYYEGATIQPSRVNLGLEYKYKTWYYDPVDNEYKKRESESAGNSAAIEDDKYTSALFFDMADIEEAKQGGRGNWEIYPYDQVLLKNLSGLGDKDGLHALPASGYFDLTRNRLFVSHAGELQTGQYSSVPIINAINVTANTSKPVIKLNPDRGSLTHIRGRAFTAPVGTAVNQDGTTENVAPTGSVDINTNGTYTLTYAHSFSSVDADNRTVEVTVIDQPTLNSAPVVSVGEDFSATVGQEVSITAAASDVDAGDLLTYKWVQVGSTNLGLESGGVDLESQTLTFIPPENLVGTSQTVRCEVFDGIATSIDDVVITLESGQVTDTVKPVITLIGPSVVNATLGEDYTDQGATANDNVDGDISNLLQISDNVNTNTVGTYTVRYNVSDSAGNAADEVTRTVEVVEGADVTKPVISLIGSSSVTVTEGGTYNDAGATASDDVDGDLTSSIVVVNPVDTNTVGTYTVRYNVSDSAGNAADEVTRTVEVVATVIQSTILLSLPGIPDGAHDVVIVDRVGGINLTVEGVTFANGTGSALIPLAIGSAVDYYTYNETTREAGLQVEGITI